jgi:hypothetical protein
LFSFLVTFVIRVTFSSFLALDVSRRKRSGTE